MNLRTNAGYIITDSIHIGETEFVCGVSKHQPTMFVTWACTGGNNYFWGHYHDDLLKAKKDLLGRAGQELELLMNRRERATKANMAPIKTEEESRYEQQRDCPMDR